MPEIIKRFAGSFSSVIKKSVVRYRVIFLVIAFGIFFCLLLEPTENAAPAIVFFLGRFHPLIIHFPVVLALLALLFELLRLLKVWTISSPTIVFVLLMALGGSLVSLSMGLMLYYTGEYSGKIIQHHLWGALLFTSFLSIAVFLFLSCYKTSSRIVYRLYLSSLIAANVLLGYTAHQGGSLTHGSEYLTEYMPSFSTPDGTWQPKPREEMLVFEDVITPILDRKCLTCHNENKAKGDLIMTSYKELLKGGKGERPALKPGASAESDIYRRVTLPLKDDDHMPPEGKTGMSDEEIALLGWWIDKGGNPELKVIQASADTAIHPLMQNYLAEIESRQRTIQIHKQNTQKLIQTVSRDNYVLGIDPYNEQGITLSMSFPASTFGDNDVLHLETVFERITKASFIGSDISDDVLYHIARMSALQELYLQQTKIKGTGLVHLTKLKNLELLDLSKSDITDAQILNILHMPSLKDVYVNETKISPEILKALKENKPGLHIHEERGKLF